MNQSNDASSEIEPTRPKRAFGRNMPIKIGLGCFGAMMIMACLFTAGVLASIHAVMCSSDAYKLALAAAQREPSVIAVLGKPIRAGWFTIGQIDVAGPSGKADLEIPISGPRGSGKIALHANKAGGKWSFSCLDVYISGRSAPLDLLAAATPH